ncbi:MAG: tetratricopeptide repeat protein, partial [Planctomycetota bacterium]
MGHDPDQDPRDDLVERMEDALGALRRGSFSEFDRLVDADGDPGPGTEEMFDGILTGAEDAAIGQDRTDQIGGYRIIREIGRGGMGVVYEAEQQEPRRYVALKVIRGRYRVGEHHRKLFQREIDTLARLKHPGIATIFEAGHTDDGQHFFAMELVQGASLAEYVPGQGTDSLGAPSALRERLRLFCRICEAVNHAHQHGVVHRDLKPSNVVVNESGVPKVLDFGLARITDADVTVATTATETGQLVGTLPYMSPEQIRGNLDDINIRSDIYSLGVILYELTTGRRPYELGVCRSSGLLEAARIICEDAPTAPRALDRALRGDLETIILKALEKEPARRYQSAAALADDVERYLSGHPIVARPPSTLYQLRRLAARHKLPTALGVALFLLAITFAVVFGVQTAQVAEQRDQARAAADRAERINEYLQHMLASFHPYETGSNIRVRDVLEQTARELEVSLADQPEIRASLHDTLGMSYLALGLLDKAEFHVQAALDLRKIAYGERHPLYATSLHHLGCVAGKRGQRQKCEAVLQQAYDLRLELLGEDHIAVAESLQEIARCHGGRGEYERAELLAREALAILRRKWGEHRDVATSLHNLAILLVEAGRYEDAEPLLTEALEMRRQLLGNNHFDVARTLTDLGDVHWHRARYDRAEQLTRERVRILRNLFGEGHHELAWSLGDLAVDLAAQGRLAEAESLHREALSMERRVSGDDHVHVALPLNNLAVFLREQGRYIEAEPLARETYRLWTRNPAPHPSRAYAAANLASVGAELEQHDEAEELYRDAIKAWRSLFGTQNPSLANALAGLGRLLQMRGDYAEAERLYREGLEIRRARLGEDHPKTARSQIDLAGVLHVRGAPGSVPMCAEAVAQLREMAGARPSEISWALSRHAAMVKADGDLSAAEELYREAIAIERGIPRQKHPVLADCLGGLADLMMINGQAEFAEPLLREALDIRQTRYVEGDRRTALTRSALGACLVAQGRYGEAEPLLVESHGVIEAAWGELDDRTLESLKRLVNLYEAWSRPDEAGPYRAILDQRSGASG